MPDPSSPNLCPRDASSSLDARPDLSLSSGSNTNSLIPQLPRPFTKDTPGKHAQMQPQEKRPRTWNTADLPVRIGGDVLSAASAAGLVAPLIMAVDRSIIENAAQRRTITQSLRATAIECLTRPLSVLASRPFGLVFMLYFATYFTANSIDTASSTLSQAPTAAQKEKRDRDSQPDPRHPGAVTAGTPKFLATSATNLTLCVYKDTHFTRLFGVPGAGGSIPRLSMALFAARDALTVFASFNVPPLLAPALGSAMPPSFEHYVSRASAAQFLAPAAFQVFSTPLHLWGLDLYNNPGRPGAPVPASERVGRVVRDWGKSCAARVGRIVPAFGVGGVVNASVRRRWMGGLPSAKQFE